MPENLTDDLRSPRAASQWDSVPVPELVRLRRIEVAAKELLAAYDDDLGDPDLIAALKVLSDAVAPGE